MAPSVGDDDIVDDVSMADIPSLISGLVVLARLAYFQRFITSRQCQCVAFVWCANIK
jgi:hypothetical protein